MIDEKMTVTTNDEYAKARQLHGDILAYGENCATALVGLCKSLKKMRDSQLYKALGMESFDDYCVEMVGIKSRMAYNYIGAYEHYGEGVLQSNANLGITKLSLIAQLPPDEQADALNGGEIDGMSVAEVRELVKKAKDQGEQLSLFEKKSAESAQTVEELKAALERERKEHAEAIATVENQIELMKNESAKAAAIAVDEKAIRAEIKKELKAKSADEIEKAVKKGIEKERSEIEKAAIEKAKAESTQTVAELTAANKRADDLAKQLAMSDSKQTTVNIYFNVFT